MASDHYQVCILIFQIKLVTHFFYQTYTIVEEIWCKIKSTRFLSSSSLRGLKCKLNKRIFLRVYLMAFWYLREEKKFPIKLSDFHYIYIYIYIVIYYFYLVCSPFPPACVGITKKVHVGLAINFQERCFSYLPWE